MLVPDQAVRSYSEELESTFEQLHRLVCKNLITPVTLEAVINFIGLGRDLFYKSRDFLEQDFGISEAIALRLPPPVDTPFLRMCSTNAESVCGRSLYYGIREVSRQVPAPPFNDPVTFWQTLGRSVFEFNRCLSIIRGRIYPIMPVEHKRAYRLPWLDSEDVCFEDATTSLESLFFPFPRTWEQGADAFLWSDLTHAATFGRNMLYGDALEQWIEEKFKLFVGRDLRSFGSTHVFRYSHCCDDNPRISMKWWSNFGKPLLLTRADESQRRAL